MARKQNSSGSKKRIRQADVVVAFGCCLRRLRLARGLSQLQVARAAGIHVTYVGRLERGAAAPGLDLMAQLAAALQVSLSDLLPAQRTDPMPLLHSQARRRLESILGHADAETVGFVNQFLTLQDDVLLRKSR